MATKPSLRTDGSIPLDEGQQATVRRYVAELQQLEGMVSVKKQALNDIISAFISGKGLQAGNYNLDLPTMVLKATPAVVRPGPVLVPNSEDEPE